MMNDRRQEPALRGVKGSGASVVPPEPEAISRPSGEAQVTCVDHAPWQGHEAYAEYETRQLEQARAVLARYGGVDVMNGSFMGVPLSRFSREELARMAAFCAAAQFRVT